MSDNIFCALAWDQVPIIPEASSCVQSLFTSFAVVSVIKNFTPFCINRFQNTFCHSYRGKFHLLFFSLSCLLPVDFCMLELVGQHKARFPGEEEKDEMEGTTQVRKSCPC